MKKLLLLALLFPVMLDAKSMSFMVKNNSNKPIEIYMLKEKEAQPITTSASTSDEGELFANNILGIYEDERDKSPYIKVGLLRTFRLKDNKGGKFSQATYFQAFPKGPEYPLDEIEKEEKKGDIAAADKIRNEFYLANQKAATVLPSESEEIIDGATYFVTDQNGKLEITLVKKAWK